jgi:hypothetical protein
MAENTTSRPVRLTGVQRPHPTLRRLGRACITLVRWQKTQKIRAAEGGMAAAPADTAPSGQDDAREVGHD